MRRNGRVLLIYEAGSDWDRPSTLHFSLFDQKAETNHWCKGQVDLAKHLQEKMHSLDLWFPFTTSTDTSGYQIDHQLWVWMSLIPLKTSCNIMSVFIKIILFKYLLVKASIATSKVVISLISQRINHLVDVWYNVQVEMKFHMCSSCLYW